jgi:hypothetical protein
MIRIYLVGAVVLVAAIFMNAIVQRIGLMGWYEFLSKLQVQGRQVLSEMGVLDFAWLFLLYPFLLGLSAYAGDRLHILLSKWIFQ